MQISFLIDGVEWYARFLKLFHSEGRYSIKKQQATVAKLMSTGVYSNTNWPPFTGGENSILNWVLKLNPLNQEVKGNKSSLDCLERALFILFLPLGVTNGVKSLYKKKN